MLPIVQMHTLSLSNDATVPRHNVERLRVLVAGAGGLLGRLVVAELVVRGHLVRAAVHRRRSTGDHRGAVEFRRIDALRPAAWMGTCDTIDVVVSALGASVNPSPFAGWRPYTSVDAPANIALLEEAQRAGVRRFVYVSVIGADSYRWLNYAEGHERVVDALRQSGMPATVIRPTGFYAAMGDLVRFARRGAVPVIGDGACKSNPIHEADLAIVTAECAAETAPGFREVNIGGPEEMTRREIAALTFEALGKKPKLVHVPSGVVRAMGHVLRLANPRAGHFVLFAAYVMTHPCVAPKVGTRRMSDYFREMVETERRSA